MKSLSCLPIHYGYQLVIAQRVRGDLLDKMVGSWSRAAARFTCCRRLAVML